MAVNKVLELASAKVRAFVEACGAKVITLEEFDKLVGGMPRPAAVNKAVCSRGFYNPKYDVIVINMNLVDKKAMDRTLLHELGHWSGHSSRLQRKVVVSEEKRNSTYKPEDFDTEEIIAEMTAYTLGLEMGLMTEHWQTTTENYIASYRKGNIHEARKHVKECRWFLVKIALPGLNAG